MKKTRLIFMLVLVGLLGAGAAFYFYFLGFDRVVLEKFQGRLWELPARVYARPLELYPGMILTPDMLDKELDLMAYQKISLSRDLDIPGKYSRSGNQFELFCRPFDFGDKKVDSHRLQVTIQDGRIARLKRRGNHSVPDMVRLDPVLVGSFYPASREDRILKIANQRDDSITLESVLVGEVWFSSGQSNMVWTAGSSMCRDIANEIAGSKTSIPIREINISTVSALYPQTLILS